jgi:hypothetical protein
VRSDPTRNQLEAVNPASVLLPGYPPISGTAQAVELTGAVQRPRSPLNAGPRKLQSRPPAEPASTFLIDTGLTPVRTGIVGFPSFSVDTAIPSSHPAAFLDSRVAAPTVHRIPGADPAQPAKAGSRVDPGRSSQQAAVPAEPDDDGIRPMSLPPSSSSNDGNQVVLLSSGGSGGSGGGTPPDKPPILTLSGGGLGAHLKVVNGQPVEGDYEADHDVPIGTVLFVGARNPDLMYQIQSFSWSGIPANRSYTSADPVSTVTGEQTLGKNSGTTASQYNFIVDTVKTYTISVTVHYTNGANGTSRLTFSSVAPSATLTTASTFIQLFTYNPQTDEVKVGLRSSQIMQATTSTGEFTA